MLPPLVALLLAAVVGDVLILTLRPVARRGVPPAARRHVGQRVRLRPGALQGDDAHLHRTRRRARAARRAVQHRRREPARRGRILRGARRARAAARAPRRCSACRCASSRRRSAAALVGAVPGVLKARFGAHEVIVTIMLNFIVLALLNYLTCGEAARARDAAHAGDPRADACRGSPTCRPRFHGSAANVVIVLALARGARALLVPLPHAPRLRAARRRAAAARRGVRRHRRRRA